MKDWSYFDKYDALCDRYLPAMGEGETVATQTVTAVCKLVYKWYNDGDVYDNVHGTLNGWANDLSSYANWLYNQFPDMKRTLRSINVCEDGGEYEDLLAEIADNLLTEENLEKLNKMPKNGSVYEANGPFEFCEHWDDEEDDWDDDDDYDDEEEGEDW